MREILFRGKRMSDGEWLYGSLLQVNRKGATECCIHSDRYSHLIDPATVGQYTGLTDKDGNGVVVREWIPVTERLPEEGGYYMVAHQRSGCVAERFYYRDCPDLFVEVTGDPVTHWMPLPEPPMRKVENDG